MDVDPTARASTARITDPEGGAAGGRATSSISVRGRSRAAAESCCIVANVTGAVSGNAALLYTPPEAKQTALRSTPAIDTRTTVLMGRVLQPTTIPTPQKPTTRPRNRRRPTTSCRTTAAIGAVNIGLVALRIAASDAGRRSSAKATSVNGAAAFDRPEN